MQFIVYALPRSRTTWLASLLSQGAWVCGHDEAQYMRAVPDIRAWMSQPFSGSVETAAAPFWRLVQKLAPEARTAIVRRPIRDVVESCLRAGLPGTHFSLTRLVEQHARKLDQIEARTPGAVSVTFDELDTFAGCERLTRHCLGEPLDGNRWARLHWQNIQTDIKALVRYGAAHAEQLATFAAICAQHIRADLSARPADMAGMVIEAESFDSFFRDGEHLFRQHKADVGEHPETVKNPDLARRLEAAGNLQVITARSNGRMFGYLMAITAPTLEDETDTIGVHTTFYASPEAPGLGLKLQRASVAALKERGVSNIFWRTGPRGDGPRMDALYRRVGAMPAGELYQVRV